MSLRSISKVIQDVPNGTLSDPILLDYLNSMAVIHDDSVQKRLLKELIREYVVLEKRVDGLLKNTLPEIVANEIKYTGKYAPRSFNCTILFSDIVGFTRLTEKISGEVLIGFLDLLFKKMDDLVVGLRGTKIKTIGDSYMAVFGAPIEYDNHPINAIKTAMSFLRLADDLNSQNDQRIQLRIGIHTGVVIAGVVGQERMQFDVFGDTVNIASRFESSGEEGRINVSHETYTRTRGYFEFAERGEIALKNKANMKAYFVIKEL